MTDRPAPVSDPPLRARTVRHDPARGWYWRATTRDAGKERTVATFWAHSRDQAVAELRRLVDTGAHLRLPGESKPRGDFTVASLLGAFLAAHQDDPDTKRGTFRCWRQRSGHLRRHLGGLHRDALEDQAIHHQRRYRRGRRKEGVSHNTVNLELETLSRAWRWMIEETPATRQHPPGQAYRTLPRDREQVKPKTRPVPPVADIVAVAEELRTPYASNRRRPEWPRTVLFLSLCTGMRISELASLRWEDVRLDTARPFIDLPAASSKTGARRIPLSAAAVELLSEARPEEARGRILPVKAGAVRLVARTHWRPAAERAGVEPFTNHGVRRRFITDAIEAGGDAAIKKVALITGHSVAVLLRSYLHPSDDDLFSLVADAAPGAELLDNVVAFPSQRASQDV